jgi:catechol 2,3-dioxygenase-like lactoylglutathione lyase family enzyme
MKKLACLMLISVLMNVTVLASESVNPSIASGVPFFYYHDLQGAADWYENKLGLKIVTNESWVVIFELTPSSHLGLVSASGGSLKPTKNKGALLSIETADLEGWWDKLKDTEGINMIHGIESGAKGMIEEFRMYDPEGYIVEFFRWHSSREESNKYAK